MNGVHDMGGMEGLGDVAPDPPGGPFKAPWQGRVHALVLASPTRGNIDAGRFKRESIPGPAYLAMSYYERWFAALRSMLLEGGYVTAQELADGKADPAQPRGRPRLRAGDVESALSRPGSYRRDSDEPARFIVGSRVRARMINPSGHTRSPRYVRGRRGVVVRAHGRHVFPDVHAETGVDQAEALYTVRFSAQELWGPEANPNDSVLLDLFEPYLEHD